jgi:hypothetical protein
MTRGSSARSESAARLKQRAASARALAASTKSWLADARAATQGTLWRVGEAWIEEGDGTRCVDLIHVGTGKKRTVRVAAAVTADAGQLELARLLTGIGD